MFGYHGRYLHVDLSRGEAVWKPLAEETLRRFLGGVGLGTYLLHREAPVGIDPLHPEAPLIFAFSPLVGTPLTTSDKFAVVAKSPLTHRLHDALSSSHLALAARRAGMDALVIVGAALEPTSLIIEEDHIRLESAQALTTQMGLGAVMGAKKLKAISVTGSQFVPAPLDPQLLEAESAFALGPLCGISDQGADAAAQAIAAEDRAAVMDSLLLCNSLPREFDDFFGASAELLRQATGWEIDSIELHQTAERIVTAKKLFNIREGWTCAEDTLLLTKERPDGLIRSYYQARGWDAEGRVPRQVIEWFDLKDL